jgi:hypothetical protein
MEIILALSTLALAAFTAWMAWSTKKLANESREASFRQIRVQMWLTLKDRFDSDKMRNARASLAKIFIATLQTSKYDKIPSDEVLDFFEDLGIAYNKGYIETELADSTFSYYVSRWWEASKQYIDFQRKEHDEDTTLYKDFEKWVFSLASG